MRVPGHVVVVGSVNLDTTLRVPRIPIAGETLLSHGSSHTPGGKGANQAVAAATVGGPVHFVGAVGADAAGGAMVENLREHGVDTTGVAVLDDAPTGTATVIVDDAGENVIVVDAGANGRLSAEHARAAVDALEAAVLLCQLEVPIATVRAAAEADRDRTFVLNPAPMAPADHLGDLLSLVDVLVPNQSELAALAGAGSPPRTVAEVTECVRGLALDCAVVVTLGSLGAAVFATSEDAPVHVAAPKVDVVDTSGAGDVFCGVLASALSRGEPLVNATRTAVERAAESTRWHGAQLSPTRGTSATR